MGGGALDGGITSWAWTRLCTEVSGLDSVCPTQEQPQLTTAEYRRLAWAISRGGDEQWRGRSVEEDGEVSGCGIEGRRGNMMWGMNGAPFPSNP